MKLHLLKIFSVLLSLNLSGIFTHQKAQANPDTKFYCATLQGRVITFIQNESIGRVALIVWQSQAFGRSGYTPQKRCQIVSAKFQHFYNSGELKYLKTGQVNGYSAICAVRTQTQPCSPSNILFTLERGENPHQVLSELWKVRAGASGPLVRGGPEVINIDKFVQNAPTTDSIPSRLDSRLPSPSEPGRVQAGSR